MYVLSHPTKGTCACEPDVVVIDLCAYLDIATTYLQVFTPKGIVELVVSSFYIGVV
jgi:hypothetical protein